MHADVNFSLSTLFGFLLVLARVSGLIVFVPIPAFSSTPDTPKIVLALAISIILLPVWPSPGVAAMTTGGLPMAVGAEFAFGLLIGTCMAFLMEGFQIAAQMIGLQAGYSFASTVDPSTQADSAVLQIVTQLLAGMLFFALRLDHEVIRVLAASLQRPPILAQLSSGAVVDGVVRLGSQMFIVGLRLAMPVVAFLILLDLTFAIMGKVHQQFQVMSLSFPAKMLAGLALTASALAAFPLIAQQAAARTFQILSRFLGG